MTRWFPLLGVISLLLACQLSPQEDLPALGGAFVGYTYSETPVVQEEIDVTAELVAAHRDRLLRAVDDLRTLVEGVEDRPAVVMEARPEPTSVEPAVASPPAPVVEARRPAEVVTRLHPVAPSVGGVGGDGEDLDAFFADDGS